ncbi:MAG: hypothetical protein A3K10_14600 [Bacteroidetes bacterium RIFCSPLOWO2_12_FULL_31_6]|nr:MAG: hypothetical protein A3K10_14600 [Bacteroidetes bacterium RIFCSPLOWO2_12_FULL_31_6]
MAKYKIKKSQLIGSPDAETDDLLLKAFVSIDNLSEIIDVKNQKSILLGRTGSGKSAIIRYIKKNCQNVQEISPESMSLRFLSNSTILKHFTSLGVNLNLFYKVLWKHVFIVELLKMHFDEDSDSFKKKSFFERLRSNVSKEGKKTNERKEKAIKYMESWSNDFWIQTELLIKNFEKTIHDKYETSIGLDSVPINLLYSKEKNASDTTVYEAKQKAERIIAESQIIELLDIIEIMKDDLFLDYQKKYFIIIDDLDKDWIEESFRLDLIGSMVDVIKEFRQLNGVKIVISLRENLNELVFSKYEHKGSQREKLKPLYSNLVWNSEELTELINNRLKLLSHEQFNISNAFYEIRRGNKKGFDYILERTYYRPRDVISFINHIIENANNKSTFTNDIIAKAEPSYSLERFQALEDEWIENYGRISVISVFLRGINNGFKIKSISESVFADLFLEDSSLNLLKGELHKALADWKSGDIIYTGFLKKILFILYRVGVLGVKKGGNYPTAFYYTQEVLIEKTDITNNSRFYVHPSLYSHFKINTIEQLPEEE